MALGSQDRAGSCERTRHCAVMEVGLAWADPWHRDEREAWRRGEDLIATTYRDAAVESLRPWARAHLAGQALDPRTSALPFPEGVPAELQTALGELLTANRPRSDWHLAAWSLLAESLAVEFLAADPDRSVVERLSKLPGAPASCFRAIEEQIARRRDGNWSAWLQFLGHTPSDLAATLERESGLAFEDVAQEWARQADPFEIFDAGYRRAGPRLGAAADWEHLRLSMLLALSPEDWSRAVDALPVPNLMWGAVEASPLRSDGALIRRLLECAPPVLDANGEWTKSITALLISELVLEHITFVHEAVRSATFDLEPRTQEPEQRRQLARERLERLESGELSAWASSVYASLLARPDGEPIAFELLARLCRTEILGQLDQRREEWSANQAALAGLAQALLGNSTDLNRLRQWWERQESRETDRRTARGDVPDTSSAAPLLHTEGLPYLVGGVVMIHQTQTNPREASGAAAAMLWAWAKRLFVGRDPGLDLTLSTNKMTAFEWLGYLLAAQPAPGEEWRALYEQLEPQRRRRAMHTFEKNAREIHGSYDLGMTGLLTLDQWLVAASAPEFPEIRTFHRRLVETSRRLYLTAPMLEWRRQSSELLASCFACAAALFGETLLEDLAAMLTPIANDPVLLRKVFEVLAQNKMTEEVLHELGVRLGIDVAASNTIADRISPRNR